MLDYGLRDNSRRISIRLRKRHDVCSPAKKAGPETISHSAQVILKSQKQRSIACYGASQSFSSELLASVTSIVPYGLKNLASNILDIYVVDLSIRILRDWDCRKSVEGTRSA